MPSSEKPSRLTWESNWLSTLNGQVHVTSMYDLCASFIFQTTSKDQGARMRLVAKCDGGPQDLPNLILFWIENEQCLPGFLASDDIGVL